MTATINAELNATTEYRNLLIRKTGSGKWEIKAIDGDDLAKRSAIINRECGAYPVILDDMNADDLKATLDEFCDAVGW